MKYLNAFVFAVGPVASSLAGPLWKSRRIQRTWKHVETSEVRGSSPLRSKWLYGRRPVTVPITFAGCWPAFIAVFMSEHNTVSTSRRARLRTKCSVYCDGDVKSADGGT